MERMRTLDCLENGTQWETVTSETVQYQVNDNIIDMSEISKSELMEVGRVEGLRSEA